MEGERDHELQRGDSVTIDSIERRIGMHIRTDKTNRSTAHLLFHTHTHSYPLAGANHKERIQDNEWVLVIKSYDDRSMCSRQQHTQDASSSSFLSLSPKRQIIKRKPDAAGLSPALMTTTTTQHTKLLGDTAEC